MQWREEWPILNGFWWNWWQVAYPSFFWQIVYHHGDRVWGFLEDFRELWESGEKPPTPGSPGQILIRVMPNAAASPSSYHLLSCFPSLSHGLSRSGGTSLAMLPRLTQDPVGASAVSFYHWYLSRDQTYLDWFLEFRGIAHFQVFIWIKLLSFEGTGMNFLTFFRGFRGDYRTCYHADLSPPLHHAIVRWKKDGRQCACD